MSSSNGCLTCEILANLLLKEKQEKEQIATDIKTLREKLQLQEKSQYEQGINLLKDELLMKDEVIKKLSDELNKLKNIQVAQHNPFIQRQQVVDINANKHSNAKVQAIINLKKPSEEESPAKVILTEQKVSQFSVDQQRQSKSRAYQRNRKPRNRSRVRPQSQKQVEIAKKREIKYQNKHEQKKQIDRKDTTQDAKKSNSLSIKNQKKPVVTSVSEILIENQKAIDQVKKLQEGARKSKRPSRGQYVKIDGIMVQIPPDNQIDEQNYSQEESKINENNQNFDLSHSSISSIHVKEQLDENDGQEVKGDFRTQSKNGGRLKCPAVTCFATRGLIQSMKQHVRETKGLNGHDRVFCLKCDSVFFKSQDREEHDFFENCIMGLIKKPKAFLSFRQKQLVQEFETGSNNERINDDRNFPEEIEQQVVDKLSAV